MDRSTVESCLPSGEHDCLPKSFCGKLRTVALNRYNDRLHSLLNSNSGFVEESDNHIRRKGVWRYLEIDACVYWCADEMKLINQAIVRLMSFDPVSKGRVAAHRERPGLQR